MLEIRPTCENCNISLPNGSPKAMVCNFECTFCEDCVHNILQNVCPNCSGDFQKRPTRPKKYLDKYPPSLQVIHKPVDMEKFKPLLKKNFHIKPEDR